MSKVICVYSSSSNTIHTKYFEAARNLGREIAGRKDTLLFGGGLTGLMGECARAVHENHGKVVGVIPKALNVKGIVYDGCDELIITEGMRERKALMDARSNAFIALPGGYGTLEELLEIITLKQLRYHNKPIVILDVDGFYSRLLDQFEHIMTEKFAKRECGNIYYVTEHVQEVFSYIDNYRPQPFTEQWLTDVGEKGDC